MQQMSLLTHEIFLQYFYVIVFHLYFINSSIQILYFPTDFQCHLYHMQNYTYNFSYTKTSLFEFFKVISP